MMQKLMQRIRSWALPVSGWQRCNGWRTAPVPQTTLCIVLQEDTDKHHQESGCNCCHLKVNHQLIWETKQRHKHSWKSVTGFLFWERHNLSELICPPLLFMTSLLVIEPKLGELHPGFGRVWQLTSQVKGQEVVNEERGIALSVRDQDKVSLQRYVRGGIAVSFTSHASCGHTVTLRDAGKHVWSVTVQHHRTK